MQRKGYAWILLLLVLVVVVGLIAVRVWPSNNTGGAAAQGQYTVESVVPKEVSVDTLEFPGQSEFEVQQGDYFTLVLTVTLDTNDVKRLEIPVMLGAIDEELFMAQVQVDREGYVTVLRVDPLVNGFYQPPITFKRGDVFITVTDILLVHFDGASVVGNKNMLRFSFPATTDAPQPQPVVPGVSG